MECKGRELQSKIEYAELFLPLSKLPPLCFTVFNGALPSCWEEYKMSVEFINGTLDRGTMLWAE